MFMAEAINDDSLLVYEENGPDKQCVQLIVNVGSLGIYRAETGIMLQHSKANEGIFVPDETIPLVADVIARLDSWVS